MSVLQVQVNQIDHYLAPPGPLDNSDLPKVPVIRIFGPSSTGEKCCVHVHQVYPYFFVEYDGKLRPRSVKRYITKLTLSLNHAIALSLHKDISAFHPQYIRAIILIKGVHFYGFHSAYSPFLKVYVADPALYNRVVTIMRSGTVMGAHYRVFESHLSFALQFAADFGLYGCGWLSLSEAFKRGDDSEDPNDDTDSAAPAFPISPHYCATRMPLEVDVAAFHILNRLDITARNIHHKLVIPAPLLPPEPLVLSVRELWEDERNRRRARGLNPTPDMPADPSESSRSPRSPWVAEARYWEDIRKRIEREKDLAEPLQPQHAWEKSVMTAFESVEALWEESRQTWRLDSPEIDAESSVDDQEVRDEQFDIHLDESFSADQLSQLVEDEAKLELDLERENSPQGIAEDVDIFPEDHEQTPEIDQDGDQEDKSPTSLSSPEDVFSSYVSVTASEPELLLSSPPDLDGFAHFEEPVTPTRSREPVNMLAESPLNLKRSASFSLSPLASVTREELDVDSRSQSGSPPLKKRRIDFAPEPTDHAVHTARLVSYRAMTLIAPSLKIVDPNHYCYAPKPPTVSQLLESADAHAIPSKVYRAPFYSNDNDVPDRPREYGGLVYYPRGNDQSMQYLDNWEENDTSAASPAEAFTAFSLSYSSGWEYAGSPPSVKQVKDWLAYEAARTPSKQPLVLRSQIEGPTQKNIYGLKTIPGGGAVSVRETQRMTILSLEVFAPSAKNPVPERDEIVAAFYSFRDADSTLSSGMVMVNSGSIRKPSSRNSEVEVVRTELELLNHVVDVVLELDPDIILGWETQNASWGYLTERLRSYDLDLSELISRALTQSPNRRGADQWGLRHNSTLKVIGRHVLNLWRIMRVEVTLNIYTFGNVAFQVLGRRFPHYGPATLQRWYEDSIPGHTATVFRYFSDRCTMNLELLEETEVVTKTAEFARVFGVDFFSVISRGSQFKVESFMFRIAKPESFVLLSPSRHDVGRQNAAECMPLILEPQSAFYTNPVLVLDFQSLYPSIMIANNYCYSTFLGRVNEFQGRQKFGATDLDLRPGTVEYLHEHITVSPNGMMFVKPEVRKGLLGRMLTELLDTRVMVKQAMKGVKDDKALKRVLDARQLGLKFIANVTYGYTSATLSGRMPAVEIADSIVQSGRETLEKAIRTINATKKWGAQVVYGDTDSVFVHLAGKTKDQAFRIGYEIAETITASNPVPIKLKFEKVYLPCVLLAKKRYVGFKYENPDDIEPTFDAKGIETVRRDGVLAQKKMTETCLKILFRTQDLSEIKDYCYSSWAKLLEGRAPVQDFIFAKEVRLGTYREKGPPPPGAVIAARQTITENAEPQYGERVPYVICRGAPHSRLADRVEAPLDVVKNRSLHLDADYYISRVLIPPLDRILSLAGVDVRKWYSEMRKPKSLDTELASPSKFKQKDLDDMYLNIDGHFFNYECLGCGGTSGEDICDECYSHPESAISGILSKIQMGEKRLAEAYRICSSCAQTPLGEPIECESLDCSWLYARTKAEQRLDILATLQNLLALSCAEEQM